jgi:hypothetical protein
MNLVDTHEGHDEPAPFFLMRKVIDEGFLRKQPTGHDYLDVDAVVLIDFGLQQFSLAAIGDHDKIARRLIRLETNDPPSGGNKLRTERDRESTGFRTEV